MKLFYVNEACFSGHLSGEALLQVLFRPGPARSALSRPLRLYGCDACHRQRPLLHRSRPHDTALPLLLQVGEQRFEFVVSLSET